MSMPTISREELGLFLQFLKKALTTGARLRLTIDSKFGLLGNDRNAEHVTKPRIDNPGCQRRIMECIF